MGRKQENQTPVASFLRQHGYIGVENRCSVQLLAQTFNVGIRAVRSMIHCERQQGAQICSSTHCSGYWIASSEFEAASFAIEMRRHAVGTLSAAAAARRFSRRNPEQIELGGLTDGGQV